jgi:hypothetical protein
MSKSRRILKKNKSKKNKNKKRGGEENQMVTLRAFNIGPRNKMGPLPLNNGTTTEYDEKIIEAYKEVFDNGFTNKVFAPNSLNNNVGSRFLEMRKYMASMLSYLESIEPKISNPLIREILERAIKKLTSYHNITNKEKYEQSINKKV